MGSALLLQQTAAPAAQASPGSREELRNQIQQTVREATQAAREAAADAKAQGGAGQNIGIPMPPLPPTTTSTGSPFDRETDMPPRVKDVSLAFFAMIAFIVVGLPLVRALARRIDKGSQAPPPFPKEVRDQFQQITQSVDAIAIEVERISEGQRFTTKMLAEKTPQDVTMMSARTTGQ